MKLLLTCLLSVASSAAIACGPEAAMRLEAIRTLYSDADLARYVCVENGECDLDAFAAQLAVNNVSLGPDASAAIQIEPLRKGRQYFSAIFQLAQCKYQMVFAPDTTLSDVKLLKQQKNNYYILRAVERDSTETWKEYDFAYDPAAHQYGEPTTRCYRAKGGQKYEGQV
jgi:hypothetical protein